VEHHGADDVFKQGDLGSLEAISPEEGYAIIIFPPSFPSHLEVA